MPASLPTPAAPAPDARRGVLAIPAFRKLWNSMLFSSLGDWLGLLATTAMAQQPAQKEQEFKTPEERAKFQTEKMASELQLTAAQKEQVYTINLGIAQKNEGIRTSTFSEEEKRSIIKSNREAQIEMLKNVLTAAQFEKMKAEMKEQHTQGGKVHNEKH